MDLRIRLALVAQIADTWAKHVHPDVDLTDDESRRHNMHTYGSFDWHQHWLIVGSLVFSSVLMGVCLAVCCKFYCHKYRPFRPSPCVKCRVASFGDVTISGVPQNEYHPLLLKDQAPPPYSEHGIP